MVPNVTTLTAVRVAALLKKYDPTAKNRELQPPLTVRIGQGACEMI